VKSKVLSMAEYVDKLRQERDTARRALEECVTEDGAPGLQQGLGRQRRRLLAINAIARAALAQVPEPDPVAKENTQCPKCKMTLKYYEGCLGYESFQCPICHWDINDPAPKGVAP
jgi:hypothetical protein